MLKRFEIAIFTVAMIMFGSAFEPFADFSDTGSYAVFAARKSKKSKASKKKKQNEETKQEASEKSDDGDYLADSDEATEYIADIYRCAECGYEQDEPGNCPDHATSVLVKISDKARNPLAPTELDGNEDIIVDIPLKNVVFRKEQLEKDKDKSDKDSSKTKEEENKKKN